MTISELHIKFDLQPENKINILEVNILEDIATYCNKGYLFVDSSDGHCYLFDKNGNEDDVKKLKKIDNGLFYYSNIESIIIPDSVKNIGGSAFAHCENLKSIKMSHSIESIGYKAFAWCKNLKSIKIPDSIKIIKNFAFACCKSLESIIIPDSIEKIGYDAFYDCKSLKSLTFKRKTMKQVKKMTRYPFGIEDESIIRCI